MALVKARLFVKIINSFSSSARHKTKPVECVWVNKNFLPVFKASNILM